MEPVYVPKNPHEKALQRALMQYRNPKNREMVEEALHLAHREDLIGYGPKCLIRPKREGQTAGKNPGGRSGQAAGKTAGGRSGQTAGKAVRSREKGSGAEKKRRTIRNVHRKKNG